VQETPDRGDVQEASEDFKNQQSKGKQKYKTANLKRKKFISNEMPEQYTVFGRLLREKKELNFSLTSNRLEPKAYRACPS
jgi:hypothetical protein